MAAHALPDSCSRLIPLFAGQLVAVDDWHCAGHDTPGRDEEWSRDDRIVITRLGLWQLEVEGDARLADPLTAMLWSGQRAYRVRHPIGGGDACTVFRLTPRGSEALDSSRTRADAAQRARGPFSRSTRAIDGRTYLAHRNILTRARAALAARDPMAIEEPTLALVQRLASGDDAQPARSTGRFADHAGEIIARDFRRPLTVDDIARQVQCSPFHLGRLYRQRTGVSLYRAVVMLRLRDALERVLDTPDQLSAIALDAGFASHSHFTDAFRAEYGCAPRDARQRLGVRATTAQRRRDRSAAS